MNVVNPVLWKSDRVFTPEQREDLLSRYKRYREVMMRLNNSLVTTLSKDVINEGGKRLGMFRGNTLEFDSIDESSVLMDYCIYSVFRSNQNAIDKYLVESPPDVDSDEMTVLHAMQHSVYSLLEIESIERGLGVAVRDHLSNETAFIVDMGLGSSGEVGLIMSTRTISFGDFSMTTGAGLPVGVLPANNREGPLQLLRQTLNKVTDGVRDPANLISELLRAGSSKNIRYQNSLDSDSDADEVFVDGELMSIHPRHPAVPAHVHSSRRVGRNESCPCGSGKKFKHCCLNRS